MSHEYLIVPAADLAAYSGAYSDLEALEPRALAPESLWGGDYALPARLLLIPEACTAFPGLASLAIQELAEEDFAQEEE